MSRSPLRGFLTRVPIVVATFVALPGTAFAATCPERPAPPTHTPITATRVLGPAPLADAQLTPTGPAVVAGGRLRGFDGATTDVPVPPAESTTRSVAVDRTGAVYYLEGAFDLVKVDAAGNSVWRRRIDAPLKAVFVLGTGAAQRVGVTYRDKAGARTLDLDGGNASESIIAGESFTPSPGGGVVGVGIGYVRLYDSTGQLVRQVGYSRRDWDPSPPGAPQQFISLGGAAALPDGRLLITEGVRGLLVVGADGLVQGELSQKEIDPQGFKNASRILVADDSVYLQAGQAFSNNQYVVKVSLADILARATHGETTKDWRLGLGAGFVVNATSNYFRPDSQADVRVVFDPSWSRYAEGLQLCWTISDERALRTDWSPVAKFEAVAPKVGVQGGVPLDLPDDLAPGAYQIDARLVRDGVAVSSTQATFMVGAPGQRLDFSALPSGADAGGPHPARGAALADMLGTGAHRVQINWDQVLPSGTTGPSNWSTYDQPLTDGAAEAARRNVTFIVQVGQGGPERAFVENGTWESRVAELVNRYKDRVHVWEAWNEPNATFGPAGNYVTKVLVPFYRAVKAADPSATVVGGSVVGLDIGYWQQLVNAGGLNSLDIAGIHPYTGHNRSWEENGSITQFQALKNLLRKGDQPVPIWNTEHSWWSDGPYNFLAQADHSARAMLWMKAFGVSKWNYFIPEGSWGNDGITFSAIQTGGAVKPAALALMTTSALLRGRPYRGQVDVGAPSAYAMRFGPVEGDPSSGEMLVAWTDELRLPAVLSPDAPGRRLTITNEFGASRAVTLKGSAPVTLDSAPTFFAVKGSGQLSIAPAEAFGQDLALAAQGATASASSGLPGNPASAAIDGDAGAANRGDVPGLPMWASASNDANPALTVALGQARTINRLVVATHSNGSVAPGIRDYDVQVRSSSSSPWVTVKQVRGQFMRRQAFISIDAQEVAGVRLQISKVNYSGYAGGAKPAFWDDGFYGGAVVAELRAYAPGPTVPSDPNAMVDGEGDPTPAPNSETAAVGDGTGIVLTAGPTPVTAPGTTPKKPSCRSLILAQRRVAKRARRTAARAKVMRKRSRSALSVALRAPKSLQKRQMSAARQLQRLSSSASKRSRTADRRAKRAAARLRTARRKGLCT